MKILFFYLNEHRNQTNLHKERGVSIYILTENYENEMTLSFIPSRLYNKVCGKNI